MHRLAIAVLLLLALPATAVAARTPAAGSCAITPATFAPPASWRADAAGLAPDTAYTVTADFPKSPGDLVTTVLTDGSGSASQSYFTATAKPGTLRVTFSAGHALPSASCTATIT